MLRGMASTSALTAPTRHQVVGSYSALFATYLRPQWVRVLVMAVLLLASIALQLVGPQVVRAFLDAARAGAGEDVLVRAALLFLILCLAQQGAHVLAGYWSERVAWTATNALRADLAAHLLRLDPGFHKARTPGELIERVDGDVTALARFFSSFVVQIAGSVLLLLGILGAVWIVDARLGVAFAVFATLALGLLGRVRHLGTPHWKADREQSAAFYGYLGEVLTATEDLRSSGAVPYAMRRFLANVQRRWPIRRRAALWGQTVMAAAIVAFAVADDMAYGLGGALYRAGAISVGGVYLVVAYTAMLAAPIETIRTQLQEFQQADAAIARVRELLRTRPKLEDGTQGLPAGPLAVELRAVRFWYDDAAPDANGAAQDGPADGLVAGHPERDPRPVAGDHSSRAVLEGLSFRLEPGRVLGLLGRTGGGKSTVARLLFRLYDPQVGEVRIGDVDLRRVRRDALRSRMALVTQDVQLFTAPLRDNITFFDPTIPDARLLAVLETLGLSSWLERLPGGLDTVISGGHLSAGEAQLVALARMFIKDPGLVILDEASSRLDPATQGLLERALDRLLQGRTAVIIAHRLATVERADDVLILENGRVLEHGPRQALAADPASRFARLRRTGLEEVLA